MGSAEKSGLTGDHHRHLAVLAPGLHYLSACFGEGGILPHPPDPKQKSLPLRQRGSPNQFLSGLILPVTRTGFRFHHWR